ncbi:MAG: cytochrome C oxidase subunit IV family protein [Saprospiraceae bacterium]
MGHLTHEESKKVANKIITILAIITIFEVAFALLGKGYLIEGFELPGVLIGGVMITLSIVKAYLIVFEFMHMKYEAPGMAKSVLIPTLLLVWGVVAFMWEGSDWQRRRTQVKTQNELKVDHKIGALIYNSQTKNIRG